MVRILNSIALFILLWLVLDLLDSSPLSLWGWVWFGISVWLLLMGTILEFMPVDPYEHHEPKIKDNGPRKD